MDKSINLLCVLAVALAVTSTCEVASQPQIDADTKGVLDNTSSPKNGFYFRSDSSNETDVAMERGEDPTSDDSLKSDNDPKSEKANETEVISPSGGQRIRGGYETNITNHPYQVSVLQRRFSFSYLCSGSIVSKSWVLTAAHCLMGVPSEFTVRAGSSKRKTGGTAYRVSNIYIHFLYDKETLDNDIGVIRIYGTFEYNRFVQPIPLAKSLPRPNTIVTVAGWGLTSHNGPVSDHLMAVNLTVATQTFCEKSFPYITPRMFCAGFVPGDHGTCDGDSGGPLVADGVQVGLVTGGECDQPKLPAIFTKVHPFRKWIRYYTSN